MQKSKFLLFLQINLILCFLKYIGQAADFTSTERLNKLAAFQRKALAHALSCKFVSLSDAASWFLFSINSKDSTTQLLIICEYFNDINGCVYHFCQFRMLRELFTAHALSTKLKMKMLLNLFYHLLHPMVFNWKLRSQNGTAVVSRWSRAVSKFLNLHKYVDKNDQIFHISLFSWLAAECLLRTDPKEDKEGFFIALFVRRSSGNQSEKPNVTDGHTHRASTAKRSYVGAHLNLFKMFAHAHLSRRNCSHCDCC